MNFNSTISDIEAELTGKNKSRDKIHLRIQQRNGKKCITTIEGEFSDEVDLKKLCSDMKKKFSCSGSLKKECNEDRDILVIIFTGDQRQNIVNYLVNNLKIVEKDDIIVHGY